MQRESWDAIAFRSAAYGYPTHTWTVVVIRDPGFDYLRPDLDQASSTELSVSAKK